MKNGGSVSEISRRRLYIHHMKPPRFTARMVRLDDDNEPWPFEEPADVISGSYRAYSNVVLCEIDWIDEVPRAERNKWLEAAADAVQANIEFEAEALARPVVN